MRGVALSTAVALILMVVSLVILFVFILPILTQSGPDFISGFSQAVYQKTFCTIDFLKTLSFVSGCQ
jgi:hypothetical protein